MVQADVNTPLDARTRLGIAQSTPRTPAQKAVSSPWALAAGLTAVWLFRKQIFSPGGLLFAAGFLIAKRVKTEEVTGNLQGLTQGLLQEQATFTINRSAQELYDLWHDVEKAPTYQESIRSVKRTGGTTSHWVMDLPNGQTLEWDAEWTAEEPGKRLAYRTIGSPQVPLAGQIVFEPAVSGRGTVVRVNQEFLFPGGKLGAAMSGFVSRTPGGYVRENLRHFKQLAEAGEIPTTRGQSHGERQAATRLQRAATGDREQQPTVPETGAIAHYEEVTL